MRRRALELVGREAERARDAGVEGAAHTPHAELLGECGRKACGHTHSRMSEARKANLGMLPRGWRTTSSSARASSRAPTTRRRRIEERSVAYQHARRELLEAERDAILALRNEGHISDEAMHNVERDLDLEDERLDV